MALADLLTALVFLVLFCGALAFAIAHFTSSSPSSSRLTAVKARHAELTAEYDEYLSDVSAVLRRPALSDPTVPETAAFVEAYALLSSLPSSTDLSTYESAVSTAWSSWRTASAAATRTGTSLLPAPERTRAEKAVSLLNLALDPAASDAERTQSFAHAKRLVDALASSGHVVVHPTTSQALSKVALALPA